MKHLIIIFITIFSIQNIMADTNISVVNFDNAKVVLTYDQESKKVQMQKFKDADVVLVAKNYLNATIDSPTLEVSFKFENGIFNKNLTIEYTKGNAGKVSNPVLGLEKSDNGFYTFSSEYPVHSHMILIPTNRNEVKASDSVVVIN